MKLLKILMIGGAAALLGWLGWYGYSSRVSKPQAGSGAEEREVLYYQSAMHPWVRSDRPGKCTICGMELTPIYRGQQEWVEVSGLVTLSSNASTVLQVAASEIDRGNVIRSLRLAGVLEDDDSRHRVLSAYAAGRIERLHIRHVGQEVVAGEPLATFYSPALFAAEREYLALLGQDVRVRGTDPGAEALLRSAASRLQQLGLTTQQIAALPAKPPEEFFTEFLAPTSGTIVARYVYAGQYVNEGERMFELADFSTLWLQLEVYEPDLRWIQVGQEVQVTTASLPGRVFSGSVAFVDPNIDPATRSTRIRVELPNPVGARDTRLLMHRAFAEGVLESVLENVLRVPRSAVLSPGGNPVVYVQVDEGAYQERAVRLGVAGDTYWEVLEGLRAGERVASAGHLMIDAEAELRAPGRKAGAQRVEASAPSGPDERGLDAVGAVFRAAGALSSHLAEDEFARFGELAADIRSRVDAVMAAESVAAESIHSAQALREALANLGAPADLRSARKEFFRLSEVLVPWAREAKERGGILREVKVFVCPMTGPAFEGAPRRAEWIQWGGPIRNPYFGSQMLDCGSEVR